MKLIAIAFLILALASCSNSAEDTAVIKNSIASEAQLQQMNVMLYNNGNRFSENVLDEFHSTPKNPEYEAMRDYLNKTVKRLNQIDSVTLTAINALDRLKISLMEIDNGNHSFNLNRSIIPNNFDLSLLKSPLNTGIATDFFINSDETSSSEKGLDLFNILKSYRNDLITIVAIRKHRRVLIEDITNYGNNEAFEKKVISEISSMIPFPIDDKQVATNLYINLTLPKSVSNGNKKTPWILATFQHSNLIGAITQLTILQNKVLEARAIALQHISLIGCFAEYGFDRIVPFASGPSLIHEGETAEISVGMAAFDSYNQPGVTLESIDGEVLKPENGTGKVRVKPKKGLQKIQGTVSIKNKSGIKKTTTWEWDIQVLPKK